MENVTKFSDFTKLLKYLQDKFTEIKNLYETDDIKRIRFFFEKTNPSIATPKKRYNMEKYNLIDTTEFTNEFIPKYSESLDVNFNEESFNDNILLWDKGPPEGYLEQKPLRHQNFVMNFLNDNSPYRGLLFYHGLGSGKTGASIMSSSGYNNKQTFVMIPASLSNNFKSEIKDRFGDNYMKKMNNWKWMKLNIELPPGYTNTKWDILTTLVKVERILLKTLPKEDGSIKVKSIKGTDKKFISEFLEKDVDFKKLSLEKIKFYIGIYSKMKTEIIKLRREVNQYYELLKKLPVTLRKSTNDIGIWIINDIHENIENYSTLDQPQQNEIDIQIENIFNSQYKFFNYNAGRATIPKILDSLLPRDKLNELKKQIGVLKKYNIANHEDTKINNLSIYKFTEEQLNSLLEMIYNDENDDFTNPFDNKTLIIDEIHNLTSIMISGSIIGLRLYEMIMRAKNLNIILLSGTPTINTPYQLAITFNILKGIMILFNCQITSKIDNIEDLKKQLYLNPLIDRFSVTNNTIVLTRVPNNFINNFNGERRDGVISGENSLNDKDFKELLQKFLLEKDYIVNVQITHKSIFTDTLKDKPGKYSLLDKKYLDIAKLDFADMYVDSDSYLINDKYKVDFQKRITGLVSHYNEISIPGEDVFPSVKFAEDTLIKCELSNYQYIIYMNKRIKEKNLEEANMKKSVINGDSDNMSYFKVLTRQSGNFVFPSHLPRPEPAEFRKRFKTNKMKYIKQKEIMTLLLTEISDDSVQTKQQLIEQICESIVKDADSDDPLSFKNIYTELINNLGLKELTDSSLDEDCSNIVEENMDLVKSEFINRSKDKLKSILISSTRTELELKCYELDLEINDSESDEYLIELILSNVTFENLSTNDSNDIDSFLDNPDEEEKYNKVLLDNINKLSEENLQKDTPTKYNLNTLSPKFLKILENLNETPGLAFAYSQFREAEGVGIFLKVLEKNGYTSLDLDDPYYNDLEIGKTVRYSIDEVTYKTAKITDIDGDSVILGDIIKNKDEVYLCKFIKWIGETSSEERTKILTIFNNITNKYGQQCLLLLGTAATAEGISLKYVRQVHIFEPYWNQVKTKQVIDLVMYSLL